MATLVIQIGGFLIAAGLLFMGIQGLREKPDLEGKMTSKGTAIPCLIFGFLLGIASFLAPKLLFPEG